MSQKYQTQQQNLNLWPFGGGSKDPRYHKWINIYRLLQGSTLIRAETSGMQNHWHHMDESTFFI